MTDVDVNALAQRAREVSKQLRELWADEGVDQLSIFLDPDIISVLDEIKRVSLDFVDEVASLEG
ncbi:MAG: hypothetical protein GXP38_10715 [Chloroflexi bacterium]|nr:hypothetical protein [Chloroflexota bacterium]